MFYCALGMGVVGWGLIGWLAGRKNQSNRTIFWGEKISNIEKFSFPPPRFEMTLGRVLLLSSSFRKLIFIFGPFRKKHFRVLNFRFFLHHNKKSLFGLITDGHFFFFPEIPFQEKLHSFSN